MIKQYEVKKINGFFYNAIIETEVETFNKSLEKLKGEWNRRKVYLGINALLM